MKTGANPPPMPTTTAAQARLRLFQPTRRPQRQERYIETPWGRIRVNARLGQQHADVLEAICYCRERRRDLDDGAIKILVDPANVRRRSRQASGTTFRRIIDDLQQAVVEIIEPRRLACQGQLLGHINKAVNGDGTAITRRDPLTGGQRELWSVTLGPVLAKLLRADVWIGYDPARLSGMRHGICQAVARHILSHETEPRGGWSINNLIRAVAGEVSGQAMRDRRRELNADEDHLNAVGLIIEDGRIRRVEHKRGSVEHKHGSVEHKHGARSISTI